MLLFKNEWNLNQLRKSIPTLPECCAGRERNPSVSSSPSALDQAGGRQTFSTFLNRDGGHHLVALSQ